jgi:hypothetical protein
MAEADKPAPAPKPETEPAPGSLIPISAPRIYGSGVAIQGTGNDITLIFNRPHPATKADGGLENKHAINEITGAVTLSPQTAKDLLLTLSDILARQEKDFGEIRTQYMRTRQEKK